MIAGQRSHFSAISKKSTSNWSNLSSFSIGIANVDSTDLSRLEGAWVKINELEFSKIKSDCSGLIVTKGSKGAEIVYHDYKSLAPQVEVVDVTGAGDTFLSALTFKYLETHDIKAAVDFAIKASAITVQHFGCYAPKLSQI